MDASAIELAILKFVPALNWVMSFNFPWFCESTHLCAQVGRGAMRAGGAVALPGLSGLVLL